MSNAFSLNIYRESSNSTDVGANGNCTIGKTILLNQGLLLKQGRERTNKLSDLDFFNPIRRLNFI